MIYVRAADNLNNRSEISAEIMVTLGTELVLGYLVGYPNPFEENATLVYDLTREADVTVRIYSTAGRLIRTLQETGLPGQNSTLLWDGRDEAGDPVANGVYFVKLDARDTEAGGAPHTATARLARIR
jgi:hypothetical protein